MTKIKKIILNILKYGCTQFLPVEKSKNKLKISSKNEENILLYLNIYFAISMNRHLKKA